VITLSGGTARSTGEYYVYRTRPAAPVETLVQKRITRLERRVSYLHLHLPCSKTSGWKAKVQIAHIREREFQTGFRLGIE
jgi:hypothetical protein